MENKIIISRFLKANVIEEKKHMKPFLLKCGLALALTFAGFLYSHMRIKRLKSFTTSPNKGNGNQVKSGGDLTANSSFCSTVEIEEEPCLKRVISNNSISSVSPKTKQIEERDEFLLHEFSNQLIETNSFKKDYVTETPRSRTDSPVAAAYGSNHNNCSDNNKYIEQEQEIKQLRNMIRDLQERERSLEVQLLEYCGLREQEAVVMELQNRLKISSMEAKMFNLKVETLQCEKRRLETQVADHSKVVAELDAAKTKVKFMKKKIKYEAEQSKEQIMNLKQRVSKLQDQESREIEAKMGRVKELELEAEELRKSVVRLQMENSELGIRLESTQILAHAVLEDPQADAQKQEMERLMVKNEALVQQIEQLQQDRCSDVEELVYLRWINACLRHELRHYNPPPGKTVARDLSKNLSPTSEKKAKRLILEYAHNDLSSSYSDSDQWSLPTDPGEIDDYSLLDHSGLSDNQKASSHANKSRFIRKLMKLIRGRDGQPQLGRVPSSRDRDKSRSLDDNISPRLSNLSNSSQGNDGQHQLSRVVSFRDREKTRSSRSLDDCISPRLSNLSNSSQGNDGGCDGSTSKSECYLTPPSTRRTSLDLDMVVSLKKDDSGRNSDSVVPGMVGTKRDSTDSKSNNNNVDSLLSSPRGAEKSNLVKYAEALKDSSGSAKRYVHRRSSSYSSF